VRFRNPAGNGQAQPRTTAVILGTGTGFVSTEKTLKNARLKVSGDASTCIRNAQNVFLRRPTANDRYASSIWRVLDGIIKQIQNHAAQQGLIGADG
jgi:hypothetical protein